MEIRTLLDLWPILIALLGFVVWLVRLEMTVKSNHDFMKDKCKIFTAENKDTKDRLKDQEDKHHALNSGFSELKGKIDQMCKQTDEIHGKLFHGK